MKLTKRLIAMTLVLATLFGMTAMMASAESVEDSSIEVETGPVSVEGTNSVGNLIMDAITETEEKKGRSSDGRFQPVFYHGPHIHRQCGDGGVCHYGRCNCAGCGLL